MGRMTGTFTVVISAEGQGTSVHYMPKYVLVLCSLRRSRMIFDLSDGKTGKHALCVCRSRTRTRILPLRVRLTATDRSTVRLSISMRNYFYDTLLKSGLSKDQPGW